MPGIAIGGDHVAGFVSGSVPVQRRTNEVVTASPKAAAGSPLSSASVE